MERSSGLPIGEEAGRTAGAAGQAGGRGGRAVRAEGAARAAAVGRTGHGSHMPGRKAVAGQEVSAALRREAHGALGWPAAPTRPATAMQGAGWQGGAGRACCAWPRRLIAGGHAGATRAQQPPLDGQPRRGGGVATHTGRPGRVGAAYPGRAGGETAAQGGASRLPTVCGVGLSNGRERKRGDGRKRERSGPTCKSGLVPISLAVTSTPRLHRCQRGHGAWRQLSWRRDV